MTGFSACPKPPAPGACLFALVLLGFPASAQEPANNLIDFRGKPIDEKFFSFVGPYAKRQIKEEAEGLRIILPAEFAKPAPTGLLWKFPVRGDFEITLAYELLKADKPANGAGIGVNIYLKTDTAKDEAILFGRMRLIRDGNLHICTRTTFNAEGTRQSDKKTFPTEARSGKLRLIRKGREVDFQVAEEGTDEFRHLHFADLGTEDVKHLRIAADPGGSESPVEVRIRSFEVRQQFGSAPQAPIAADESSRWPMYVLPLIGLLILGGGWFGWRMFAKSRSEN